MIKMKKEFVISLLLALILIIGLYSDVFIVSAATTSSNTFAGYSSSAFSNSAGSVSTYSSVSPTSSGFSSSAMSTYWPQFSSNSFQNCNAATTDFLVAIPPGGCTPNVVRSDLLAEQNVPVFCKVSTLKINPLIDVSAIKSMSFSGNYPQGVSGVSYHPAREATRNYNTLLSSPYVDDAGYVVILLSRQGDERDLPQFIEGNLTARISYDAKHQDC